jgi:ferredoxin
MRVRVDMTRCQTHAQCVFANPDVFSLDDNDELVYDANPDDSLYAAVEQAASSCPVRAIYIEGT